ncbi:MAG: pentapeptide repeat-containing protein, partial [Cyanobacteria bacterium P01_D01_bin.56]
IWTPAVVGLLALVEGISAIAPDNRAWHDRIARTRVAIAVPEAPTPVETKGVSHSDLSITRMTGNSTLLEQDSQLRLYGENPDEDDWWLTEAAGNLTSLVLAPRADIVQSSPPGKITLFKSSFPKRWLWWILTSGLLLAGGIGFGVGRATRLSASTQTGEDVFLETAQKLIDSEQEDNRAAILMLAQADDPRTVHYLADLLSQTNQPETLTTLQQTLISKGLESIPSLSALSRGLASDLQQPLDEDIRQIRLAQRHVVQGAIAKLLAVHSNELAGMNLDRVDLSLYHDEQRTFRLIQPGLLAAGTSWQRANLNQANLTRASFFDVGPDGIPNSYDDIISELSGVELENASLEETNLQGAQLDSANLRQADLTHANLAYGNFEQAQLSNARLMHVNAAKSRWQGSNLVGADLTQAIFDEADVRQARLSRIDASHSHWLQADLAQSYWVGANLMGADFTHADLTSANFQGANLDGVSFNQANLRQANLRDTDLRHVNLLGATLTDADLAGAILDDGGSLSGSFITPNAQLNAAQYLQGVNFSRVRNLDNRQLNYICAQGGIHPACKKELGN